MNKPNMIDDIGSLRIKCINLESEILVLKKELASSQAEVEFWKTKAYEAEESEGKHESEITRLKALQHYHHESYCRKCGSTALE